MMFMAYFITISSFLICIYATIVIIDGIKSSEEEELKELIKQFGPKVIAKYK